MSDQGWFPPRAVLLDCARGVSLHERQIAADKGMGGDGNVDTGATNAALSLAQTLVQSMPIDLVTAVEMLDAHTVLAGRPVPGDGETIQQQTLRLLWGGDTAVEWVRSVITEAQPQPTIDETSPQGKSPEYVAATVAEDVDILNRVTDQIFAIENEGLAALEAAFWVAFRQALRAASHHARGRANRNIPIAAQAGLPENAINEARERINQAGPYDGWIAAGPVLAAISADLDQAVSSVLEDYETTAAATMDRTVERIIAAIAATLGISRAEIEALRPDPNLTGQAARLAAASLLDWVRERLSGDRNPDTLADLSVPGDLFTEALGVAGGGTVALDGEGVGTPLITRVLAGVAAGSIVSRAITGAVDRLTPRRVWVRGAVADPHPWHEDLDGVSWGDDTERAAKIGGFYPRDHRGCKCRIKRTWRR